MIYYAIGAIVTLVLMGFECWLWRRVIDEHWTLCLATVISALLWPLFMVAIVSGYIVGVVRYRRKV